MSPTWKTIRIFISSTFRDMHAERDLLVQDVFLELKERCARRRLHLIDVDLRWGVTEEEEKQGKVLEICLDEIERCRPFFIGLLGERYGWIPSKYEVADPLRYDWLKELDNDDSRLSVTALEIYHGVLRSPSMQTRAFFYFRDPSFLTDVRFLNEVPLDQQKDFLPESPAAAVKLKELKTEIRNKFPVFENYPCAFEGVDENKHVRLSNLEAFGKQVLEDLWSAIEAEHPDDASIVDEVSKERGYHDAFIETRTQRFIGRSDVLSKLEKFVHHSNESLLVLTGSAGAGKSAVLAQFAKGLSAKRSDIFVLAHFIGASPGSTDIRRTLLRLCRELASEFEIQDEIPSAYDELRQTFLSFLTKANTSRKVVLVIDALNQLDDRNEAHGLGWLPQSLPPGSKVIVSVTDGSDCLNAFRNRRLASEEIAIGHLNESEQKEIVRQTLALYRKRLDETADNDQLSKLLRKRQADNPLYLTVACEEMRVFGEFERVTARINDLPEDIDSLFEQVLERIENDQGPERVRTALALLACSRQGLLESELLDLLAPPETHQLPAAIWARLYRPLQFYLRPPGETGDGVLDFFHQQLAEAVRKRYLGDSDSKTKTHQRLANYFRTRSKPSPAMGWSTSYPRGLSELPYHLFEGHLFSELLQVARDEEFLLTQATTFDDDPAIPLETLQSAIKASGIIDDGSSMVEFVLAHARRVNEIRQESPIEALRRGNLVRALELADMQDLERCELLHLLFAFHLYKQNDEEGARSTVARLLEKDLKKLSFEYDDYGPQLLFTIHELDEDYFWLLQQRLLVDRQRHDLAKLFISAAQSNQTPTNADQLLALASEISKRIENYAYRAKALTAVAAALNQAKAAALFSVAVEAALSIESADERAETLSQTALAQTQAGLADASSKTFAAAREAIWDATNQSTALMNLGVAQAKAFQFTSALESAEGIYDSWRRSIVLRNVAEAQVLKQQKKAAVENFEAALVAARRIQHSSSQSKALCEIVGALARANSFGNALKIANSIEGESSRDQAFQDIAVQQAQIGDSGGAHETLSRIKFERHKYEALTTMKTEEALAQTKDQDFANAVATASTLHGFSRARVLTQIALAQMVAGNDEEARRNFDEAMTTAAHSSPPVLPKRESKTKLFSDIATAQINAGYWMGAVTTMALAIGTTKQGFRTERLGALRSVAMIQAQNGDFAGALQTAQLDARSGLISPIVKMQASQQGFAAAVESAHLVKSTEERLRLIRDVAKTKLESEGTDSVHEVFEVELEKIRTNENNEDRYDSLKEIASCLAHLKQFSQALGIVDEIQNPLTAAEALTVIAVEQTQGGLREVARATFAKAVQKVGEIKMSLFRSQALEEIAAVQLQNGELTAALDTARTIDFGWHRVRVTKDIAVALYSAGLHEASRAALTVALEAALATDPKRFNERRQLLRDVAIAQWKTKNFSDAFKTIQSIDHSSTRSEQLVSIVKEQLRENDLASAFATSDRIEFREPGARALTLIGQAQLLMDDRTHARKTFAKALTMARGSEWEQASVLRQIAKALAVAKDFTAALETAQVIELPSYRDEAFAFIARRQIREKLFEATFDTIEQIGDYELHTVALRRTATMQAICGKFKDSLATFLRATKAAKNMQDRLAQAQALKKIVEVQVRFKDFSNAKETLEMIDDKNVQGAALERIAVGLARSGRAKEAVDTVLSLSVGKIVHLTTLVTVLVEKQEILEFKRLLSSCAEQMQSAYKACELVAQIYPHDAGRIATLI